jgi:hypothetical protein
MSNPTTPFSWQMPTSTDLVTDLPADFAVFGQAVATSMQDLLGGTTGQVLAKASNADMDFVWSADAAGMTNPMTTTGDTIYSSPGSTPVRRAIGTTGQVLTVSGGIPVWATPSGGKLLQVVSAVSTTQTSIASTSLTDTTVTATITPTLNTSKILVLISAEYFLNRTAAFIGGAAAVLRGVTTIVNYPAETNPFINASGVGTISLGGLMAITYLDSPATTSATTYKLQSAVERTANSASITFQYTSAPSTITLLEIGA